MDAGGAAKQNFLPLIDTSVFRTFRTEGTLKNRAGIEGVGDYGFPEFVIESFRLFEGRNHRCRGSFALGRYWTRGRLSGCAGWSLGCLICGMGGAGRQKQSGQKRACDEEKTRIHATFAKAGTDWLALQARQS